MKIATRTYQSIVALTFATAAVATLSVQAYPLDVPNWSFEVPRGDKPDGLAEGEDVYMVPQLQSWYQYNVNTNGGPQRYWNPGATPNTGQRFADTGFGGIAPDGDHVGIAITRYNDNKNPDGSTTAAVGDYVRDFEALAQVLENVPFDPTETYTLTVQVGHPPGNPSDPQYGAKTYAYNGYAVQLLAGGYEHNVGSSYAPCVYDGTVIVQDENTQNILVNTFQTITVTYDPAIHNQNGQFDSLAGQPIQIRLCALEDPTDHSTTSIVAFDKIELDGPMPTYATWSGGALPEVDTNIDGITNAVAWALGANSPTGAIGPEPTLDSKSDATYSLFTFNREVAAEADPSTTIIVQYGNNLVGWTTAVDNGDSVIVSVANNNATTDTVQVRLKRATLGTSGKLFARLKVVVTVP